ncbi:transposase family protein [Micromonospora inyonensis]|uniref:DDE superfamily endonuclease n=1 Tax=Micromonospora inyonensis TaxID=47866 RepID=A0A1C6RCQ1_9ACTN|nr:transposase family protein [Micromonospora inyonensis]SCL14930.1 DDE superfamily endonuclease [Micromonospora inyonensis]SCL17539.1 DDE superfamily endonuclease [Micromonospora inyonensis]SCL17670.1 DDE superfamily endonuclease [Micromonospora inyonensis]
MSVTYTAVLPAREETVSFLANLLTNERVRRGTRANTRSLSVRDQAILVLRWFLDGTRMRQLAQDNAIGKSTGYDYLHEGIDVLAARSPSLHGALLAAKAAGHGHVNIDGMLIETDRCRTPGPTPGVDLWWSGKHDNHGGNVQVVTVGDGWPIWTSPVRPGREHDTTALRAHTEILPTLANAGDDLRTLGDLGYEGESDTITVAFKRPKGGQLTLAQQQLNKAHNSVRAIGERGNSLLKTTFKALRNISLDPWRIGKIVAAALVILHIEHTRTT